MGSSTRKLRRAAGFTGYEYQRDLKRAAAAQRRAERPALPQAKRPRVYEAEHVTVTIGDTAFDSIGAATVEPYPPVLMIDDPITRAEPIHDPAPVLVQLEPPARRRVSPLQLIALVSMLGLELTGRGRYGR